jgi:hypothetical protein
LLSLIAQTPMICAKTGHLAQFIAARHSRNRKLTASAAASRACPLNVKMPRAKGRDVRQYESTAEIDTLPEYITGGWHYRLYKLFRIPRGGQVPV